jgi:hypothetical protein
VTPPRRFVPRSPWLLAAAAPVVAVLATDAFARGGGGGNFGGGGGGGDGGGGGGGIIIWLLLRLIQLAFAYPPIGVPLLLVALFIAWKWFNAKRDDYTGNVIRRGSVAIDAARQADLGRRLQARDPSFDPEAFKLRVRAAFRKTQVAWCAQDLTAIRPFVSDGVHERFALQLDEERALGYRDRMDDLTVDGVSIVHAGFEGAFDVVTLRVSATARDYRVSLTTGHRLTGSDLPESFAEYWTFLRRRGAKSPAGRPGLLEGNCPNCGDAVEGNQFADCRTCKSRLRSGEFDWVLAEITQSGEWTPRAAATIPGVAELVEGDREFCAEAMEDRASVAFWRWAMAMRLGDAKPLAGIASDDVVRAVADAAADTPSGRRYVGECGVGAVEVVGVVRDEKVHNALVEVRWSGTEFEARGGVPRRLDRTGVRSWLLVFERAASAKSRIGDSFSSAHCRGCGAPAETTASVCAYCKEPLTDVNLGWTLTRMTTRSEAAGRVLLGRLRVAAAPAPVASLEPPPLEGALPAGVVAWAARVAASDGVVDARERAGLERLAARASISPSRLDEIVAHAMAPGTELPMPESPGDARAWFDAAARIAVADGIVTPDEMALLERLAAPADLSAADVRILVNRARADVYHDAKAALRAK